MQHVVWYTVDTYAAPTLACCEPAEGYASMMYTARVLDQCYEGYDRPHYEAGVSLWYDKWCTASACCGESTPLAERGVKDRRVLEVSARNSRQPRPRIRPARAGPDRARVGASWFGMLSARSNAPGRVWHQGVRLHAGLCIHAWDRPSSFARQPLVSSPLQCAPPAVI